MAELMRLQKYMALCGVASRRSAEDMITAGKVCVNGKTVTELGTKIDAETDAVTVNGKAIIPPQKNVYVMLNKPKGYVTTAKDNFNRKTVLDLIPEELGRVFPVGRLDYDSEGLLLLTNDGDLTYRLTHPSHEITKSYLVLVAGVPNEEALTALRCGVIIDGRKTLPAKAELKRTEAEKAHGQGEVQRKNFRAPAKRLLERYFQNGPCVQNAGKQHGKYAHGQIPPSLIYIIFHGRQPSFPSK